MFFRRISCISFSRRSHACITPNFSLLCYINFRTVLHARWAFSNEMVSSSTVTSSSSLSTGFSLLNISSAMSSNVKDPPVSTRSSASRKSDSSISSFSCNFSSAGTASQISNSSASSGSDRYSSLLNLAFAKQFLVVDSLTCYQAHRTTCRASSNVNSNSFLMSMASSRRRSRIFL